LKQVDLKAYMRKKNMTYNQAAAEIGCSPNHLEAVANGRHPAGLRLRRMLSRWSDGKVNVIKLAMIEVPKG